MDEFDDVSIPEWLDLWLLPVWFPRIGPYRGIVHSENGWSLYSTIFRMDPDDFYFNQPKEAN